MLDEMKSQVILLRQHGMKPRQIAQYTGAPVSSAWSICRNEKLKSFPADEGLLEKIEKHKACAYCGETLMQPMTGRRKRFCSDQCRRAYWKAHRDEMKKNPKSVYTKMCPFCGKTFEVYGNRKRKYCCHEHYVWDHFGSPYDKEEKYKQLAVCAPQSDR